MLAYKVAQFIFKSCPKSIHRSLHSYSEPFQIAKRSLDIWANFYRKKCPVILQKGTIWSHWLQQTKESIFLEIDFESDLVQYLFDLISYVFRQLYKIYIYQAHLVASLLFI